MDWKIGKRHSQLRELAEALHFQPLELLSIHQVRWLSRGMAVECLVKLLQPVLEAWREESSSLLQRICNFKMLFILHGLADVLPLLNRLKQQFQEDTVDITSVGSNIEIMIVTLRLQFQHGDVTEDLKCFLGTSHLRRFIKSLSYREEGMFMQFKDNVEEVLKEYKLNWTPFLEEFSTTGVEEPMEVAQ